MVLINTEKPGQKGSRAVVFVSTQLARSAAKEWIAYSCKRRGSDRIDTKAIPDALLNTISGLPGVRG
jgi:hypothetical protein